MAIFKDKYEYSYMGDMVMKYAKQTEQELKIRFTPPTPYRSSLYFLQTQLRLIEKNSSIAITKCVGKWCPISEENGAVGGGVTSLITLSEKMLGTRFWLRDGLIIVGVMQRSNVDLVLGEYLERICEVRMAKAPLVLGEVFFAGEFHTNTNADTNTQP